MHTTATFLASIPKTMRQLPPVLRGEPELAETARSQTQRLPVWEERARKMGFPPSALSR